MLATLKIQKTPKSRLPIVDFDALGFGNVFSDHMFRMQFSEGRWHSPEILPYGPIPIAPAAGSLHYGQAVFEGLKVFRGRDGGIRIFRPDMNAKRLIDSCKRLCIPSVEPATFIDAIRQLVRLDHAWIPARRGQALYVRPIIFSSEGHLEVRPATSFEFIVMTAPVRSYYGNNTVPVGLKVERKFTRAAPGGTGYAKTAGNYGASLLPGEESRRAGFDQVLWLDGVEHRYVEEVGQMNIFFKVAGRVITPELRGTILPGVTRDSVITLLRDRGYEVDERLIAIDEVIEAARTGRLEEAFGAGTAAVISPVGRVAYGDETVTINDNRAGSLTQELYEEITAIQFGEIEDRHDWTMAVGIEDTPQATAAAS